MSPDKPTLDQLRIDRRHARPASSSPLWIVLLVLAVALAAVALWYLRRPAPPKVRTAAVREVSSSQPRTLLNASGYVTARREATVSSKVTGKVIEVLIEEGMNVESNQVLARLDASNVSASLRLAQAQLASNRSALAETRVRLDEAQRELQRVRQLALDRIASSSDLDRAEAEVKSLEARLIRQAAEVAVAEQEVAVWEQQLEDTVVRAPFSGIVTTKNAQPGEMISPVSAGGGFTRTGICTIVDMNSLEVEVDVNESYINRVAPGQQVEATLDAYPDWRIPSRVIAIIPTADRQKATVKVRVGFDQLDPRVLPEMGVKVAFKAAEEPASNGARAFLVPSAALHEDSGTRFVWVFREGRVERRAVTTGPSANGETPVVAGLNAGERIVLDADGSLTDGAVVVESMP